jgi:hypothetical protein
MLPLRIPPGDEARSDGSVRTRRKEGVHLLPVIGRRGSCRPLLEARGGRNPVSASEGARSRCEKREWKERERGSSPPREFGSRGWENVGFSLATRSQWCGSPSGAVKDLAVPYWTVPSVDCGCRDYSIRTGRMGSASPQRGRGKLRESAGGLSSMDSEPLWI